MNGHKYLVFTAASVVAVVICFIVVLGQFNLMVYPAHITAISLSTGEKGVCRIEFLGEKLQLAIPDLELLRRSGGLNCQELAENAYRLLQKEGWLSVVQLWDTRLKSLLQELNIGRFLNTFEIDGLFSSKNGYKETVTGVGN